MVRIVYHHSKRTDSHYIISTNLFPNYISFVRFFLFSPHYNQILCSLFCIYHITHNIRQENEEHDNGIVLVMFPSSFCHTHHQIEIDFGKRKGSIIHCTYYTLHSRGCTLFVAKSIPIMSISFSFSFFSSL